MKNKRNPMDKEPRCCDNEAIFLSFDHILDFGTFRLVINVQKNYVLFDQIQNNVKTLKSWFRLTCVGSMWATY